MLDSKTENSDGVGEDMEFEEYRETYEECDSDGISLKRAIKCPYCGAANKIDFAEVEHFFDVEDYCCEKCDKRFRIHGSIWEYPLGVCNHEDINVEALEEDEE